MRNRFFLAALMITVSACAYSANGEAANDKSKGIELENFYGLIINSPANIILEQADINSIRFEGEQKDINSTTTMIENGNLQISGSNQKPLTIYISFKEINLIEINGNARIYSSQVINSDLLLLKINGSGTIRLDVRSLSLGMIVKGSGKIYASGSTGVSYARIYGEGKIITTDLDSFESTEEVNSGRQAYRSSIRKADTMIPPSNMSN